MMRPDWDDYFLDMVPRIGSRSTCNRGRSGALAVRDRHILCTGYAGAPPGFPHCDDAGHEIVHVSDGKYGSPQPHCVRTIHAEQNAILQAAKLGASLNLCTMYCSMEPCKTCAMMLISVGCERVVALNKYRAAEATRELFRVAGVELVVKNDREATYA